MHAFLNLIITGSKQFWKLNRKWKYGKSDFRHFLQHTFFHFLFISKSISIVNVLMKISFIFISEISPFAVIFEALDILWSQFHLCEFLREMFSAILIVKLWLVWSRLLFLIYCVPVYAFEPWMSHDVLSIRWTGPKSGLWILIE